MSATTTTTKVEQPPIIVKCPHCGQLFDKDTAALTPWTPQEFPKAMYKTVPVAKAAEPREPEEEVKTASAENAEEQAKLEGEGYSENVPTPPAVGVAESKKSAAGEKKDDKKPAEEPAKKRW